jgi:hypothetical protein
LRLLQGGFQERRSGYAGTYGCHAPDTTVLSSYGLDILGLSLQESLDLSLPVLFCQLFTRPLTC